MSHIASSSSHRTLLSACVLSVAFLLVGGCAHWSEVTQRPPASAAVTPPPTSDKAPDAVAVVRGCRWNLDGSQPKGSDDFRKMLAAKLREAGLFANVTATDTDSSAGQPRHLAFALTLNEQIHPRAGVNTLKAFVTGISLFILSPLLPMRHGFESEMVLDVERWDGLTKRYSARAEAEASYHMLAMTKHRLALDGAAGKARDACLNALMNQLVSDRGLLLQESSK